MTKEISTYNNVIDFYKKYSVYTDPGNYVYLYDDLPESLTELCDLLKCQLIHPIEVEPYRNVIPPNRYYEDPKFPTVEEILAGLLKSDSNGFTCNRKVENRLVVTCRYHSILLASILKNRDIPVRLRYGFATYLSKNKDFHITHVICEVWNDKENRWMYVDPDRKMIDFPREEFELGGDAWIQFQNGKSDEPEKYGAGRLWGHFNILDMLCHDLISILGQELLYWERPPIAANDMMDISNIEKGQVEVLNRIALLLINPDEHFNEILELYGNYEFLQY
jgi:hypothetical protein